jgi:hypothetical protein
LHPVLDGDAVKFPIVRLEFAHWRVPKQALLKDVGVGIHLSL